MSAETSKRVTIREVGASLGLRLHPVDAASAGREVARLWHQSTGSRPLIEHLPKHPGHGHGTQALATYPAEWAPKIEAVIIAMIDRLLDREQCEAAAAARRAMAAAPSHDEMVDGVRAELQRDFVHEAAARAQSVPYAHGLSDGPAWPSQRPTRFRRFLRRAELALERLISR